MENPLQDFIRNNFATFAIHSKTLATLESITDRLQYRKNEVLFAEGKTIHKIVLVESGYLMAYSLENDRKKTQRFWFPNQLIYLTDHLFNHAILQNTIIALTDTSLLVISFQQLIHLKVQNPEICELINQFNCHENLLLHQQIQLLNLPPKIRYKEFMSQHPQLINLITAENIATYLNMGYSTFARFRQARDG